jgi:hypothetical protein
VNFGGAHAPSRALIGAPADEFGRKATRNLSGSNPAPGEYGGGAEFDTRGRVCSPEYAWLSIHFEF